MRVRVLTLNIWGLPMGLARDVPQRMHAVAGRLEDLGADVVCLQEVWSRSAREILVRVAGEADYRHVWHREASLGGSGLLVLSRLPLRNARFQRFRLAGLPQRIQHADYYGGKGFVLLEVGAGSSPTLLLVTHLQADYVGPGERDEYVGMRIAQVVEIADALRRVDLPVIAVGDFNMEEGDAAYEILTALSGLQDAAVSLDARQATCLAGHPYRAPNARERRIDFVLTRPGTDLDGTPRALRRALAEPLEIDGAEGGYSDHAALLAEIEVGPARPARDTGDALARQRIASAAEQAFALLAEGRAGADARRSTERRWAAGGLGVALLGELGARSARRERRSVLSAGLRSLAGLSLLTGAGFALLSEHFVRDELSGYTEVERLLEALRVAAAEPATLPAP